MMNLLESVSAWIPLLYFIASLLVIYVAYYVLRISLSRLRLRGVISRRFEETAKLLGLAVLIAIVVPAAISTVVAHPLAPTLSVAVAVIVVSVILASLMGYISNSLSYLVVALTSSIKDGEYVKVVVDGKEYEGRVMLVEGNYMVLKTDPGTSVLIPYSRLLRSVIVKLSQMPLILRIRVSNPGNDVSDVVNRVAETIRKSKLVNKATVSVRPLEIGEDSLVLLAETETQNPKNIGECFEEIVKALIKELPYKVTIEVVSMKGT